MKVVVVAAGDLDPADLSHLRDAELTIAADGGAESLRRAGRRPDALVGDLDSVEPSLIAELEAGGTHVDRHPTDKETSDTELAMAAAWEAGATEIVLLGATGGGRLDHELANLLLLADPALAGRDVMAAHGSTRVRALHPGEQRRLEGRRGDTVTLLPVAGDVSGIRTQGLRWPLEDATLLFGRSRGLSNEVLVEAGSVVVGEGTLLVVETAVGTPAR